MRGGKGSLGACIDLRAGNSRGEWVPKAPSPGAGRNHLGVPVTGGRIWAIDGQELALEGCRNQQLHHSYDPASDSWAVGHREGGGLRNPPMPVRHISSAVVPMDRGFLVV